jgi:uncharacterized protein (TIGR03067 family)
MAIVAGSVVGAHAGDLEALQGRWKAIATESAGQVDSEDALKQVTITFTGGRYEFKAEEVLDRGSLKVDETQSPKTMDTFSERGSNGGKVVKMIYELSADTLRICYAFSGHERPTAMTTRDAQARLLVVYRREK